MDLLQNPDRAATRQPASDRRRPRPTERARAERAALVLLAVLTLLWTTAVWAWTVRP